MKKIVERKYTRDARIPRVAYFELTLFVTPENDWKITGEAAEELLSTGRSLLS